MIWIFQQIPLVIMNRFGSGMWEGTISALIIAYALGTVPMALVSHTVLLSVFPSLAKHANESSPANVKDTFFQTLRGSFFILIPVGFFLSGFAKPIAALCVSGGEITLEGTSRIANALIGFGWSVFVLYADLFVTQCLIAVRKTTVAILLGVARAVLTYLLSYLFVPLWDYQGLALAFSAALALNFFVLFPWILSPSPFVGRWKEIFAFSGKVLLASSPILLCGALASRWTLEQWMGFPPFLLVLAMIAGGLIGTVCYLGVLALMKLEEFHTVLRSVRLAFAWQKEDTFVADLGD